MELLALIAGIVTGLFGGVGLERYRAVRKDLEHRRDHYHRFLTAVDNWVDASASDFGKGMEGAAEAMSYHLQAMEVFGNRKVLTAARELEATLGDDDADFKGARQRLVNAMNRDVGPRRFYFFRT